MRPVSVFVGGLGDDVEKSDLEREFSKYGELCKVWVARNPPGFAFIEYENMDDANDAIDAMNGTLINNSRIRVELSRNSGRRGDRRGGRGGRGDLRDEGPRGGSGYRGDRDGGSYFRGDPYGISGRYGGYGRDSMDNGYGSRYGSAGGQYSFSYGSSVPSYGGMGDVAYRSTSYRSRSPIGSRMSSHW